MKFFLFLFLFLAGFLQISYSQSKNKIDCNTLKTIIESEIYKHRFPWVCAKESAMYPFTIIDSSSYLKDCDNYFKICNRQIIVSHKWRSYLKIDGYRDESKLDNIVVVSVEFESANNFMIDFWEPLSNGHIKLSVKKLNDKIEIKTIEEGSY